MIRPEAIVSCVTAALLFLASCGSSGQAPIFPLENDTKNASKQQVGERLFVETRFAEYFAAHMTGVNDPLVAGDPVVAQVLTTNGTLPGPFAGESINCRSWHFVVEFRGVPGVADRGLRRRVECTAGCGENVELALPGERLRGS